MELNKPILQLLDEFILNQGALSEISRIKYRDNLRNFILWMTKNANIVSPTRRDIIAYRDYLIKSGKAAMTIDVYMAAVKRFFAWLEDEGIYDNIAAGIRSPQRPETFCKDYLKIEQISLLLSSIDKETIIGLRDYAIINLMIRTGLRCIEVSRLDISDLYKQENQWYIDIQGKGRHDKDKTLGITENVVKPILDYLDHRKTINEDQPLFINHTFSGAYRDKRITTLTISKMIKARFRAIGLNTNKLTAHSLRHTAAILALKGGASLDDVRLMLRHADIKTTSLYLKAIEKERMLQSKAIKIIDVVFDIDIVFDSDKTL